MFDISIELSTKKKPLAFANGFFMQIFSFNSCASIVISWK